MVHTIARIDLSALAENIERVRKRLPQEMLVLFAVKSDGYGHGIEAVSQIAEEVGIDYLGTDTVEEGEKIRSAGVKAPILLLAPLLVSEMRDALRLDLTPSVSDLAAAERVAQTAREMKKRVNVQVNVDTGMGRFGVKPDRTISLFQQLGKLDGIIVEGVFSHLSYAEAETPEAREHSLLQIERFESILSSLDDAGMLPALRHIGNSAAVIQYPERVLSAPFNMVRIGTLFYGYPEVKRSWTEAITPIAVLTARVISLKDLSVGDCVGYDCTYRASRAQRVATTSIGYGAGFPPGLSNSGCVWLHGEPAPIVGKVCLDHTIIDVTDPIEPLPDDHPLRSLPNAIYTPHVAGSQGTELGRMADWVCDEVERFVAGRPQRNRITRDMIDKIA